MIIFGHRLYGRVDRLSNGWYVATQFGHIDYIPLIPMATWLVTSQQGRGWRGMKIPFSFRSILMTYARAAAVVMAIVAIIMAIVSANDPHATAASMIPAIAFALVSIALVVGAHYAWRTASAAREEALIRLLEARNISGSLPPGRGFDVQAPRATMTPMSGPQSAVPVAMPVGEPFRMQVEMPLHSRPQQPPRHPERNEGPGLPLSAE